MRPGCVGMTLNSKHRTFKSASAGRLICIDIAPCNARVEIRQTTILLSPSGILLSPGTACAPVRRSSGIKGRIMFSPVAFWSPIFRRFVSERWSQRTTVRAENKGTEEISRAPLRPKSDAERTRSSSPIFAYHSMVKEHWTHPIIWSRN